MFIIDHHKVTVQLAPERPKPQAERLQLQRKTKTEDEKSARSSATGEASIRGGVDTKRPGATPAASSAHDSMADVGVTFALIRIQQQLEAMSQRHTKQEAELKGLMCRREFVKDGVEHLEDVDVDIPLDSNDEMLLTDDNDSKSAGALRKKKVAKKGEKKSS